MYKKLTKEEKQKKSDDLSRQIADKFIKAIQENKAPWQKGWSPAVNKADYNMFTMGNNSSKTYQGFNAILTCLTRINNGSDDPRWFTFGELVNYNKSLKNEKDKIFTKGKMIPIKFYNMCYLDENGKRMDPKKYSSKELEEKCSKKFPVLTSYMVANANQTFKYSYDENGKPLIDESGKQKTEPGFTFTLTKEQIEKAEKEFNPKFKIEEIIKNTGVKVINDTNVQCFFDPKRDEIHVPQKERFSSASEYYQTLAHELIHWAGDKRRLDREEAEQYSKDKTMRAKEELVAEIGCYLLCRDAELYYEPNDNNKAYVQSWCSIIDKKNDAIEEACKKAQKASSYIMDFTRKKNNKKSNEQEIVITKEDDRAVKKR